MGLCMWTSIRISIRCVMPEKVRLTILLAFSRTAWQHWDPLISSMKNRDDLPAIALELITW